jgi:RNA dependent RNA polymerase
MIGVMGRGIKVDPNTGSKIVNYSNSQLKNHSVWMLVNNDIPDIQIDKIIKELGEFSDKEGPLKMYARRGQCFTTTKLVTELKESEIRYIEDISRPKTDDPYDPLGNYVFTDGCGNISRALCEEINEKFDLY